VKVSVKTDPTVPVKLLVPENGDVGVIVMATAGIIEYS
jgi:hypothetical protein